MYKVSDLTMCVAFIFILLFFLSDFDINHVNIDIIMKFVPVAGQAFNLTCCVDVPDRFAEDLTSIRWTYDLGASQDVTANSDASVGPIIRDGDTFTSVLSLIPVKTNDARRYYCHATINVFATVDRTNRYLIVQSKFLIILTQIIFVYSISSKCIISC